MLFILKTIKRTRFLIFRSLLCIFLLISLFFITSSNTFASFRFVSWGDAQNESSRLNQTANLVSTLNPSFTIFNGDLENDGSTLTGLTTMTNAMGSNYSKTFLVRGNHDTHISGSTSVWTNFFNFSNTSNSIGATNYTALNSNLTYSFDYDNSRFIAVDVPGDVGEISSAQLTWINSRLTDAETNHPEIVHAFIYFHGPIYCIESTHCSCSTTTANCTPTSIVNLINNHPVVSAFFHGHEHILGWTHISSSRISGITHEVEQLVTSPSGGWTYNSYIYPARVDFYDTGSAQGFASIDVNGNSFTVNFYRVGNPSPVWTHTFTKSTGTTVVPTSVITSAPSSTPPPNATPTPPGNCFVPVLVYGQTPIGSAVACTQVMQFSWTDNALIDHYALRIDEDPESWSGNCSSVNSGDTCLDYINSNSYTRAVTPGKTYKWWVEGYVPCGLPTPPIPTSAPTSVPTGVVITPTSPPITPPVGGRVLKYYGVDRGNPISDTNYSLLSQHAVKTIVVDTDVHGSSSSWQNMMNLATTYDFNVVVWPSDWTKPVPNCGWESPYISDSSGDFITRVKPLLDAIGGNTRFIGIVNAHEPMWSCITTVKDMETIKNQLKDYIATKFGRSDFKVWNYIDNVTDMRYLSDYTGPSDIGKVMDVAVTWQHCFGGAEGTCPQAQQKIINDRAAINNAGLDGKVDLLYLFQTFAMSSGYRMPTETEMHDWSCNFLNTGALDGFLYYTWGACWYSSDLYCPASTHPYQNLWPIMNNVYNECVNK